MGHPLRATPHDVLDGDILRRASMARVPSILEQPATGACAVIHVADARPAEPSRTLAAP